MAREDIAAGRTKQVRGKGNDILGAVTGNSGRQMKGKLQKVAGKVQSALGRGTKKTTATRTR